METKLGIHEVATNTLSCNVITITGGILSASGGDYKYLEYLPPPPLALRVPL